MMATSVTVPVMMIFSFMPMLSMFNATIAKIAKFTYSEQISLMLGQVNNFQLKAETILIIVINMAAAAVLFTIAYKKSGLA